MNPNSSPNSAPTNTGGSSNDGFQPSVPRYTAHHSFKVSRCCLPPIGGEVLKDLAWTVGRPGDGPYMRADDSDMAPWDRLRHDKVPTSPRGAFSLCSLSETTC